MPAFDAIHAGLDEMGDETVVAIETGMGEDGDSTGVVDEADGIRGGHAGLGDPSDATLLQETIEGVVVVIGMSGIDQCPRHVGTTRGGALGGGEDILDPEREPGGIESGHHFMDALLSDGLEPEQFRKERG